MEWGSFLVGLSSVVFCPFCGGTIDEADRAAGGEE